MRLMNKVAIVTGGASGMGEAICRKFAKEGAKVVIADYNFEGALKVANEINAEILDAATAIKTDVSVETDINAMIDTAITLYGKLDILVNNAGITKDGLFVRMSDEDWDAVLEVNLTSVFRLTRELTHPMMRRRFGRIVNITSVVGGTGTPGQANYCASKAGMIGFSKSLAQEIATRSITVNCVAPGFIETAMTDKLNDEQKGRILTQIPAGRMGSAAEIAAAVLYLSSAEAGYVTGATLHVNGGMAMI